MGRGAAGFASPAPPRRGDSNRPPRAVALPSRRDRILSVSAHRIGPFDFLATIGCRLSEVAAARNAPLGRVLRPTRRLAHEVDVLEAIADCIPTLGEERARRLERILVSKSEELPRHVWNAFWLDEQLERFLSSGPAALIGRRDRRDGARQLSAAAEAIRARDVDALDDAFERLRDDPAAGPRLLDAAESTRELERISELIEGVSVDRCSAVARHLMGLFSERFGPVRAPVADLDRDAQALEAGLRAVFEVVEFVEPNERMALYRDAAIGDGSRPGVGGALRDAIVGHARAWNVVFEACETTPGGVQN